MQADPLEVAQALREWRKQNGWIGHQKPFTDALKEFLSSPVLSFKSPSYQKSVLWTLQDFGSMCLKLSLHEITQGKVEEWLNQKKGSPASIRTWLAHLSSFFSFTIKHKPRFVIRRVFKKGFER
jgi:hypothetical protein